MNKVFKSAVSKGFVFVPIGVVCLALFLILFVEEKGILFPASILVLAASLVMWSMCGTRYTITPSGELRLKSGPFRKTIKIADITSFDTVNVAVWKFAASLDRFTINYNHGDAVIVSPKDKQGFVDAIKAVNPNVEVKL